MAKFPIPLADRVVIQRDDKEGKTKSGILLPDTAQKRSRRGRVLAVGEGECVLVGECWKAKPGYVKKGDTVLFSEYSGNEVTFDGVEYLILRQDEILAIVTDTKE